MRGLAKALRLALILACLGAASSFGWTPSGRFEGWEIEEGVEPSSYAVVNPVSTNLSIDSGVLACEEAEDRKVLQLQIYLSTEGPLAPKGVESQLRKDNPRAEIAIDGRVRFAPSARVWQRRRDGPQPELSHVALEERHRQQPTLVVG